VIGRHDFDSVSTKLPARVASLDDIPAQVTLPIAGGEIKKAGD
jgi:hypothetical protein